MAIVKNVANSEFCGIDAGGVQFAHGSAEVKDKRILAWFEEHEGYEVDRSSASKKPTKADLLDEATSLGIEASEDLKVDEIKDLLAEAKKPKE